MGRKRTTAEEVWSRVDIRGEDDCWVWTGARSPAGYGIISWRGARVNVHRLAWFLAKAPEAMEGEVADSPLLRSNNGVFVAHTCGNKLCCNPNHMVEDHAPGPAKLNPEAVRSIREDYATGTLKITEIARRYGVHHAAISRILKGTAYKDVA